MLARMRTYSKADLTEVTILSSLGIVGSCKDDHSTMWERACDEVTKKLQFPLHHFLYRLFNIHKVPCKLSSDLSRRGMTSSSMHFASNFYSGLNANWVKTNTINVGNLFF